jgi:hypothetical protein
MPIFIARVRRETPVPGITTVHLELIRDEDTVELHDGDEFVTVDLQIDPFEDPTAA